MILVIWRAANKRNRKESRVSWVIEQFKDEGDRYLGGENLLELMAYTILLRIRCIVDKRRIFHL